MLTNKHESMQQLNLSIIHKFCTKPQSTVTKDHSFGVLLLLVTIWVHRFVESSWKESIYNELPTIDL